MSHVGLQQVQSLAHFETINILNFPSFFQRYSSIILGFANFCWIKMNRTEMALEKGTARIHPALPGHHMGATKTFLDTKVRKMKIKVTLRKGNNWKWDFLGFHRVTS